MALVCSQAGDQRIGVLIVLSRRNSTLLDLGRTSLTGMKQTVSLDLLSIWAEQLASMPKETLRRHADEGSICRCRECFYCLANHVYKVKEHEKETKGFAQAARRSD